MPILNPVAPAMTLAEGLALAEGTASVADEAVVPQTWSMPSQIGGVRLQRLIGSGGMGRVYAGHHEGFGREVAVKVITGVLGAEQRFLSEARMAVQVQDPHVVRIFHAGIEQGCCFVVMEYVRGQTVRQLVQDRVRLPWRESLGYALQAAQGLAAMHAVGIVHRDVKPSNLLLDGERRVKVADLGVARNVMDDREGTATAGVVGTAAYMAPEQGQDASDVTPAADIYALGISLYQMITGQVPYFNMGFSELLQAHRERPLPDPRQVVPDLPPQVATLIQRMTAKDPAQRPPHGAAMADEIRQVIESITLSTSRIAGAGRAAAVQYRVGVVAAGLGLLAIVAWLGWHRTPPPAPQTAAVAPPAPAVAPAVVPAVAAPWQTPPRSVFILPDRLPAGAWAAIENACLASGLPVIERSQVAALVREQELVAAGRVDPASAGRLGRLLGGHIAIFAASVEDGIDLRTVLVETGEVVASRFVPPAVVATATSDGLATALSLLPAQGQIRTAGGVVTISLGARHGMQVGSRLGVRRDEGGPDLAIATITAVQPLASVITVNPTRDDLDGMLAIRLMP